MKIKSLIMGMMILGVVPFLLGAGSSSVSKRPASTQPHIKYFNQGVEAEKKSDWVQAASLYRKSLKAKRDYPDALSNLGFSLHQIGESYHEKSIAVYKKALKLNPNHVGALEYLGELYIGDGRLLAANDMYQRLKKLDSKQARTLRKKLDRVVAEARKLG